MEKYKEEIDKILNELEEEIDMTDLKIRANAYGTHFSNQYIITLRDDYNDNEGRRDMLNKIRNKIHQLNKEE